MKAAFLNDNSPIITCSTGTGNNQAIGVVRLSGQFELNLLDDFFSLDMKKVKPRFAHLTMVQKREGQTLDQVMILFFPGPNSYTGENVLEIHCHGNVVIVNNLLQLFVNEAGFRMASPGEFTYRALRNDKLTLSQVEGLDLLLNGQTQYGIGHGIETLFGGLHEKYLQLHQIYLKLRASVELSIDFLEDIGEVQAKAQIDENLKNLNVLITELHKRTQFSKESLLSPQIVLVGPTNAGKSTLFNTLLGHNRAIVSSERGTTRDYLTETVSIAGNSFQLIDTAGLRETKSSIEGEGIRRSLELIEKAFYKILVVNPFDYDVSDYRKISNFDYDLIVFTHSDQTDFDKKQKSLIGLPRTKNCIFMGFKENQEVIFGPIEPANLENIGPMGPGQNGPIEPRDLEISGPIEPTNLENSGPIEPAISGPIEPLIDKKYRSKIQDRPILLERHRVVISKVHEELKSFQELYAAEQDIAVVSAELNRVGQHIEELIGIVYPDQVLNSIFSEFCIGK